MNQMDVTGILGRARTALEFRTDKELADHIGVPRETVASWKRRHSIPAKYLSVLTSGGVSLDWLLTGRGSRWATNEFGFDPSGDHLLDDEALWIALLVLTSELRSLKTEEDSNFWLQLNRERLLDIQVYLQKHYPLVLKSKERWLKSGLLKEKDVFKALTVEYDLADTTLDGPPWWNDKNLV